MKYSLIIVVCLILSSCLKDNCKWEYDTLHEKMVVKCYPAPYVEPTYPILIEGEFPVDQVDIKYVPCFKQLPNYQEIIENNFKDYAEVISNIYIYKKNKSSNIAGVSGFPKVSITNATLSQNSISFDGVQSSFYMPQNIFVGICNQGLMVRGSIYMDNGKPISGSLEYYCQNETVIIYNFTIKK